MVHFRLRVISMGFGFPGGRDVGGYLRWGGWRLSVLFSFLLALYFCCFWGSFLRFGKGVLHFSNQGVQDCRDKTWLFKVRSLWVIFVQGCGGCYFALTFANVGMWGV